ncbi:MAG: C-terminal binding protein [Chloroflexi bacterium]|nr:C-terminal binding protein [Chloroflexota bacterium]
MTDWASLLKGARVVRLNARLFPIIPYETAQFERFGVSLIPVEAYTPDEMIPLVTDADAVCVVSASMPAVVMESLRRCRVIARYGIGTDKLAVDAATRRGVVVANVPEFCNEEMGDHAMALLLAVARKLPQMSEAFADGAWSRARDVGWTFRRLRGRTLGLVGFGNSAIALARRAKACGLNLLVTRRNMLAHDPVAEALGVTLVDLETLLRESDYVSLHLPLSKATYHMLDDARLRLMKPGAVLINVARGALVDEDALAAALREGRLSGAGIDTWEHVNIFADVEEPPRHPLAKIESVVCTPHVAALSVEAKEEVSKGSAENLASVLSGHWPRPDHVVNPDVVPLVPLAPYDESLFDENT